MITGFKIVNKTISEQVAGIRVKYPGFQITYDHISISAKGRIMPTARSENYLVEIQFKLDRFPRIYVRDPLLRRNEKHEKIPHMYGQESLCLFQPKYREFKLSDLIADTIIPWTSLWLYHYENWHITGEWQGGGEHPQLN